MRRAVLVGPSLLQTVDVAIPEPGHGQVLLRVRGAGVCGSDLKSFTGHLHPGTDYPLLLGHEFTGEVVELGPGVGNVRVGAEVACAPDRPCGRCEWCRKGEPNVCPNVQFAAAEGVPGCMSEFYVANTSQLYPIPEAIDVVSAVIFEPLGVGLHAVENLLAPVGGETYAVIGCGMVGLSMLMAARLHRASAVYASDLTPERLALASRLGADETCNASTDDFLQFVLGKTDGRGVDVVLEAAGTEESVYQAFPMAAIHGTVIIEGIPYADDVTVPLRAARVRELRVHVARRSAHKDGRALELMADGTVDPELFTAHRFPLEQAQKAYEYARDRSDGVIKSVITP